MISRVRNIGDITRRNVTHIYNQKSLFTVKILNVTSDELQMSFLWYHVTKTLGNEEVYEDEGFWNATNIAHTRNYIWVRVGRTERKRQLIQNFDCLI